MNEIQIFSNSELGISARTIVNDDGSIYVNAEDTAIGFGWTQEKNGKTYVRWETYHGYCKEIGFSQNVGKDDYIPESLFYRLGMKASNARAEKFQNWLAMEVIPSIRKNGGYISGQETLSDDELFEKAVLVAQRKIAERDKIIEQQRQKIEQDKPKTIFADAVSASESSILVRDLAKMIRQNNVPIGEKRLYKWLRENGYICQGSTEPTQRAMELGLFERIVRTVDRGNGLPLETTTTKVTGKGQVYFINKFLDKEESA